VGSLVVSYISTPLATWSSLILLLAIHLATNHAAVRAVSMRTLNRQRANIVFSNFLETGKMLSPQQVSRHERIFEWDGVLRSSSKMLGTCRIGIPLQVLLSSVGKQTSTTGSTKELCISLTSLAHVFEHEDFLLWYNHTKRKSSIVLKTGCSVESQLRSWLIALSAHRRWQDHSEILPASVLLAGVEEETLEIRDKFPGLSEELQQNGWDIKTAALETRSSYRIEMNV
jgi:hypothetical protein